MCKDKNCTNSTPCSKCNTCDPCSTPQQPCCKIKIESFKCITNNEITSTALGIQPDDTLDEVIDKIIEHFSTLTGFYKGDKGDVGPQGPRGKRGCRGPAGTGGDSIESVVNNEDGTVTITTTSGDVFTFTVSTSGPIPVGNTVFVSKLGNDSTGLRQRFDRHFLTIAAASTAANTGDEVEVYAGTYVEIDNPFKSDVNYFLHPGVVVVCPTEHFGGDSVTPKNYNVKGSGSFYNTASNTGRFVNLTNRFSSIYLEHEEAQGAEDVIKAACSTIQIKGKRLITQEGKLLNLSGYASGTIEYENYDASSTSGQTNHIHLYDLTLDDTVKLKIKGSLVSDADTDSMVKIENIGNSKIFFDDFHIKSVISPPIFAVTQDSGIVKFTGSIKEASLGWHISIPNATTKLLLKDSQIQVTGIALYVDADSNITTVVVEDSLLERLFSLGGEVVTITRTGTATINILFSNTRIVNYETVAPSFGVLITGTIQDFQAENTEIYTKNSQNSVESDVPNNVALLTNLMANNIMSANITNTVATTGLDITTTNPIVIEF